MLTNSEMSRDTCNLDEEEEWQRSEEALRRLQIPPPSTNQGNNINNSGQIYEESPRADDSIDSALRDTLQNPQERMNILKFENKILHFVKSRCVVISHRNDMLISDIAG